MSCALLALLWEVLTPENIQAVQGHSDSVAQAVYSVNIVNVKPIKYEANLSQSPRGGHLQQTLWVVLGSILDP